MSGWTTPTMYLQQYTHEVMRQRGPNDGNAWQHILDFGTALLGDAVLARTLIDSERARYGR